MAETELQRRRQANPAVIVIFGASGDLTQRKLIPALYTLYAEGRLGEQFAVVGVARSELGGKARAGAGFREHLREAALKNARVEDRGDAKWDAFAEHLHYCRGEYDAPETYERARPAADRPGRRSSIRWATGSSTWRRRRSSTR